MVTFKKSFAVLPTVGIALSLIVTGCGSNKTSSAPQSGSTPVAEKKEVKPITIKMANFFATDHPQNVALREKFKPMIEEGSKGALKVEIYDNSKLGAEKEFYDKVRNGTIEMGLPGMIMQSDIEKLMVPEWPFLFKDYAHVQKVLNGPIGDEITKEMETKHGVKALAWSANGFRMFSTNKPLSNVDAFKGLRMRMPNVPNYLKLGQLLGANVTPMPISEVFSALEQKVVDGQDNPIATLRASGWFEVQSDVLESNHMFSPNMYVVNMKFFNSLTPEQRKLIEEASKASGAYEFELMAKSFEADKKFLQEKKIRFTVPDDKFRKDMETKVQPLYDEIFKKYPWAKDTFDKIKAEAK